MKFFNLFRSKKPAIKETPKMKPGKHTTGHTIWVLNLETLEITEAGDKVIEPEPGFWYCAALNKKNAEKHFLKMARGN